MMDVEAVNNQRIRMTEIDLGRDSSRAVRREVENATYSENYRRDGSVFRTWSWKLGERLKRIGRAGQTT